MMRECSKVSLGRNTFEFRDVIKINHQTVQECELYGLSFSLVDVNTVGTLPEQTNQ